DDIAQMRKGLADRLRDEHRKQTAEAEQAKRDSSAIVPAPRAPRAPPPGQRPARPAGPPHRPARPPAAAARPAPRAAPPVDDDLTPPPSRAPVSREGLRRPPSPDTIELADDLKADVRERDD